MKSWKPPTRRAFVAMLGAGAAAIALRKKTPTLGPPPVETDDEPAQTLPRWIGHC